jgi:hypothetical protein
MPHIPHRGLLNLMPRSLPPVLAISIGSSKWQSFALCDLASIKRESGDFSGAAEDASESQRVAKIAGDPNAEASALHAEALCWLSLGSDSRCIANQNPTQNSVHLKGRPISLSATHQSSRGNDCQEAP